MTIRFNQRWNGYAQFDVATLDIYHEAKLVAEGIAEVVEIGSVDWSNRGTLVATTTAQAKVLAATDKKIYIKSLTFEASDRLKIGFGASSAAAITAAATGTVFSGFEEMNLTIPASSTHVGYVSVGANVDFIYVTSNI